MRTRHHRSFWFAASIVAISLVYGQKTIFSPVCSIVSAAPATLSPTSEPTNEPTGEPTIAPKEDLTQPTAQTKGRLEKILDDQKLGPLNVTNVLRWAIRNAVNRGVPANTIVLLLSFPIVAMLVAAARHVFGIRGFGLFTPVVISVAFVATGLTLGLTIFVGLLILATVWGYATRRLRLQYLPRMAFLILFMSVGILVEFFVAVQWPQLTALLGLSGFATMNIFPLLVLILLTETFMSAQISHGMKQAVQMTIETLAMATISAALMSTKGLQTWVLTNPEIALLSIAATDVLLGRFVGLRIFEYWRFRELLKK